MKPFRMRFAFWLDDTRPDESDLISYIDELKQARRFASTIRDGLRLMRDLRAGNVAVLLQLFPDIKGRFQDNSELLALVSALLSSTPTRLVDVPLPAFVAPVVSQADESERKKISIQNTLAAMEDF